MIEIKFIYKNMNDNKKRGQHNTSCKCIQHIQFQAPS